MTTDTLPRSFALTDARLESAMGEMACAKTLKQHDQATMKAGAALLEYATVTRLPILRAVNPPLSQSALQESVQRAGLDDEGDVLASQERPARHDSDFGA